MPWKKEGPYIRLLENEYGWAEVVGYSQNHWTYSVFVETEDESEIKIDSIRHINTEKAAKVKAEKVFKLACELREKIGKKVI